MEDDIGVFRSAAKQGVPVRDRALDQCQVIGSVDDLPRCLGEVGDVDDAGDIEQQILDVENAELASIARCELVHRKFG